jgi:hypothetical protein
MTYIPREMFLTKGVGRHKERLASFEEALRDAKIARFNLTHVSSIYPPQCKIVPVNKGLTKLKSGQVIAVVIAPIAIHPLASSRTPKRSGIPASDIGTVMKSLRYIASGSAVFESSSNAVHGLVGVTMATSLGYVSPNPAESIRWGLSGFSDPSVWLIFGAAGQAA